MDTKVYTQVSEVESKISRHLCLMNGNTEIDCEKCAKKRGTAWVSTQCPFLRTTMVVFGHMIHYSREELGNLIENVKIRNTIFKIIQGQNNPVSLPLKTDEIADISDIKIGAYATVETAAIAEKLKEMNKKGKIKNNG